MKLSLDKKDKCTVISLQEEKLISTIAPELKAQLVFLVNQGERNIVLDLSQTRYCDSSGLSAILAGNRLCKSANGFFVISGLQETVMKLIRISQLEGVLQIVTRAEEGVDLIIMEEMEREIK